MSQDNNRTARVELVCPAGTLPALRAAVDHGADAVYVGFRGETNARNFPGLNFSPEEAATAIASIRAAMPTRSCERRRRGVSTR